MNGTMLALTPNELAEQLTGRSYISYSAITTFQQCPLKYRFKYIDQLPEAAVSASLVFGGAIHSAVEYHFNELTSVRMFDRMFIRLRMATVTGTTIASNRKCSSGCPV